MRLRQLDWARMVWEETQDIPLATIRKVMRVATDVLVRELVKGSSITVRSLGTFFVYQRPARRFYSPTEKAVVLKPITALPKLKFSNWLKKRIMATSKPSVVEDEVQ